MNALEAAELRVKLNEWRSLLKLHATLREAIRVDGLSRWRSPYIRSNYLSSIINGSIHIGS